MGVDERLIDEEMTRIHLPLAASLGIIAIGLIGGAYAQIAYGLHPLARIRQEVIAVRSGQNRQLPDDLPSEVQPLVTELNGMIAANLNMVERARVLAGNFAHALKTPLAVLSAEAKELEERGHSETARLLSEQCSRMALLIDYQTARARASSLTNAGAFSHPADVVRDVISAFSRLNAGRGKAFELDSDATDTVVACDPNDLTEMVGNLIDNAAKWARERVVVSLRDLGDKVEILVEDDGPGIPAEHRQAVFGIGVRLDEKMPGTGLGLAITHDLAALYGGQLRIERSRYDGAAVHLVLNKLAALS
ncbi:HAMP domain-containing sensor histidine kinase [Bradyrhizobium sp.]|uniref:sensor histidine kinase n=1 Tax=Bradyrhizobium sp. TaxID=376 RepID=UPI0025BB99FB|nr:HAMP domain-containing sensor histidine kinase [Bradyrhizobium sp.]